MPVLITLASTALVMGLTGGTHCLAMCAAPCGALTRAGQGVLMAKPVQQQSVHWLPPRVCSNRGRVRLLGFHLGRLLGYSMAGAAGALAMERLVWLGQLSPALRPVWTMTHVMILAWGALMVFQARQPAWVEAAGRYVWIKVKPLTATPAGVFMAGVAWALLPCGLLYTALLMAALSGGPLRGAMCMLLFGVGSGLWLIAGPWLWGRLRQRLNSRREGWGTRLAGAVLLLMGGVALWMEVIHGQPAPWCVG